MDAIIIILNIMSEEATVEDSWGIQSPRKALSDSSTLRAAMNFLFSLFTFRLQLHCDLGIFLKIDLIGIGFMMYWW